MFKRFLSLTLLIPLLLAFDGWGQTAYLINQGFESTTFPPSGWTNSASGTIRSTNSFRTGVASLAFNGTNDAIFTPLLTKPGQLSFWYRRSSNSTAWTLNVQISTDASDWTSLGTITNASTTYQEFTANLSSYSNIYIRLLDERTTGTNERYVDDFTVSTREPGTSATSPVFSNVSETGLTLSWTNGDGDGRIVLVKQGSAVDASPVDGTDYTANAAFGSGTQVGTGNYVVFKGSGNSVDITGLTASTTYYISVFEFNGSGTSMNFLTTSPATDNRTTLAIEPSTSASGISFSDLHTTSMTINWTSGEGAGRVVFVKEGSGAVTDPTDGTTYTASADWSSKGTQLGTSGYYCVYDGTGSSVALSNLSESTTYYVYIYEYNGSSTTINYRTTSPATGNQTTLTPGSDPNVALTGTDPGSTQIILGSTNNVIYRTQVSVTGSDVTLTDVAFVTSGNYSASDIAGGGLKLHYSTDATLDVGDTEIGSLSSISDGANGDDLEFTGLSQTFAVGTAYLFLSVDIDAGATKLKTIKTDLPVAGNFVFNVTVTNTGSNLTEGNVHTLYATPPSLVADNSSNNVDNEIHIAFSANASWVAAITAVKIGGTALTVTTDYTAINGNIILTPSGGNSLLTTSGSKAVTVEATGYTTASVTQQIDAGAPTNNSTATIDVALALNTTRTVTITAKDQYNNLVSGYTFKYDATITDANATTDESYTIDGMARTATVTDINVSSITNGSGIATFTIQVPAVVDANDGISVQVQLADGTTNVGTVFAFTYIPPPTVTLSSMVAINSNALLGRDNIVLQRFNFGVTGGDVTLNSLTVTTGGTYTASDIKTNGFKLWYSSDTVLNSVDDVLLSSVAAAGPSSNLVFSSLGRTISNNTSGYLFVTVNISNSATLARTLQITSTAFSNISFTSATLSGVDPVPAGGSRTMVTLSLPLVEHFDYATGSITTNGAGWVNTSGTAGQVTVENGNLTYTGYDMPATGKLITTNPAESEDVRLVFPGVTSGKVYASFLLNVSAIAGTENYFVHLGNGLSNFTGRLSAKVDGAGFALSIGKNALSTTYTGTLNFNQTYLIVLGYEIVGSVASDDIAKLWINPDLSGAEPSATLTLSTTQADVPGGSIDAFYVRQASGIPTASIDAIRIATTWADAPLPVELTSFTASAKGTSVTLNWETKTEIDNNGFEVERNSTGTWQKIGFVEGHGTANSPKFYSFSDNNPLGNKIQYRLKQIDNDGDFEYSNVVEVELAPVSYTLYQNYPNPFNPSTVIRFAIPAAGNVTVNVFNTLGEKVATLLDGQLESGYHQVTFDAANLPSGLYFYEVQAGEFKSIKKMLLMK